MKIGQIIVLLMILVFITQPASAGLFEDNFNKIIGMVTEETEEVTPEPEPEPPTDPDEPIPPPDIDRVPPKEPEPVGCTTEVLSCPGGKTTCPSETGEDGCPIWNCDACETPPVEPRPCPTIVRPFCSDQKTICPHEEDEDGCPIWDCSACDIPPEDVCKPIPTVQKCKDQKTPCPKKKDEKGCTVWDCSACEIPPEDVCHGIPISRWCPDCDLEKHGRGCLCPMKTDEKGCTVWDCDSCETTPGEECADDLDCPSRRKCKNFVCVGVGCIEEGERAPSVATSPQGFEMWEHMATECCRSLKEITLPDEFDEDCNPKPIKVGVIGGRTVCSNCGNRQCESWETKCNCPEDCAKVPPDCRRIILENGMEVIECEKECPGIPKGIIKKCEESGGKVIERTDHKGCHFIECEYEDEPGKCPAPEALEARKKACLNQGLEPMIVRKGECDTIKCRRAEPEERCDEDVEVKKEIKEKCMKAGGEIVKKFDNRGCPITTCISPEEECHKDIPQEAYENCEFEEGDLMIKRNSQGCLVFVDCVKRGKRDVEYEEIEDMPSAATLLAIALKIESLKIDFDKLARKVRAIAEYYEGTGNKVEAARFRKVAGLFSAALDKIEEIKIKFRDMAREMTEEDLRELKHDIKYVSEVIMQDALYIILGGEVEIEGSTGETEGGYIDCGDDKRCWEEALRLCEPAVHNPSKPIEGIIAKIHGLDDDGFCIIEANAEGHSMLCKVLDYGISMSGREWEILEYCEGSLAEWLKSGQKPGEREKPKPGKCVDRCGDGICQAKVCMGKGCPCQESPGLCPEDCGRPMPTEFELCTEEDEKAWQVCQNEGGLPQTDPSRYKNCEIYTHCQISPETAGECEEYTIPEIKNECYIALADKTGDSSLCVEITRPDRRDKCYFKAATTSKDEVVCEKIGDEDIKEHCYNSIEEGYYEGEREIIRPPEVEGEVVFTDDFEKGTTENWIFHNEGGGDWSIVEEDGNKFLRLHGVVQPDLPREWNNYIFKFRFKRIEGSMHVNFRKTSRREGQSRYIVAISRQMDNLNKHVNEDWPRLDDTHFKFDENWHTVEIIGYNNILNVYMDDELLYKYTDTENPLLSGMPGFEIHTGGLPIIPEFWIDDVEIRISGEKDVIGGVS